MKKKTYRFNLPPVDIESHSEEEAHRNFMKWCEDCDNVLYILHDAEIDEEYEG